MSHFAEVTHVSEFGASLAFTEIPHVLIPEIGQPLAKTQVEDGFRFLRPPASRDAILLELSRPQNRPWRPDVNGAVGEALHNLAQFYISGITRTDRDILWQAPASHVPGNTKQNGLRHLTKKLCELGGARDEYAVIRCDEDETGRGTVVTAACFNDRDCLLVESTVPSGRAAATNRRLEVIAVDHPEAMAAVNAYSYGEGQQVAKLLAQFNTTDEVRAEVLAIANRVIAPDAKAIEQLFDKVTHQHQQEAAERARLVMVDTSPVAIGAVALHKKAVV